MPRPWNDPKNGVSVPPEERSEVAIVGGGPAGAALAIRLAEGGIDVALFERWPAPRWRAAGVYSSPLTRGRLADLGLSGAQTDALIRPIKAMEITSVRGPACRLEYDPPAGGLDRVRLERRLLDRAAAAGARIHEGATVRGLTPDRSGTALAVSMARGPQRWVAGLVVGADGPRSMVARAHGVDRPARRLRHAGLTVHRADPDAAAPGIPMTARMVIGEGWYCGIAPVPGGRVNIGLVMSERRLRSSLRTSGTARQVVRDATRALPPPHAAWQDVPETDETVVALPLAQRVSRRAGPGFLLVGDAAGFVDPLSGEGLHRALVSAELAAGAISAWRRGESGALARYDQRMRARFAPKDLLSWLLQLFLARPGALDYALTRLARREELRRTFAGVMADLQPPRRALEPRFLLGLLAP
jgi:flavin-dependent dehydrogenase